MYNPKSEYEHRFLKTNSSSSDIQTTHDTHDELTAFGRLTNETIYRQMMETAQYSLPNRKKTQDFETKELFEPIIFRIPIGIEKSMYGSMGWKHIFKKHGKDFKNIYPTGDLVKNIISSVQEILANLNDVNCCTLAWNKKTARFTLASKLKNGEFFVLVFYEGEDKKNFNVLTLYPAEEYVYQRLHYGSYHYVPIVLQERIWQKKERKLESHTESKLQAEIELKPDFTTSLEQLPSLNVNSIDPIGTIHKPSISFFNASLDKKETSNDFFCKLRSLDEITEASLLVEQQPHTSAARDVPKRKETEETDPITHALKEEGILLLEEKQLVSPNGLIQFGAVISGRYYNFLVDSIKTTNKLYEENKKVKMELEEIKSQCDYFHSLLKTIDDDCTKIHDVIKLLKDSIVKPPNRISYFNKVIQIPECLSELGASFLEYGKEYEKSDPASQIVTLLHDLLNHKKQAYNFSIIKYVGLEIETELIDFSKIISETLDKSNSIIQYEKKNQINYNILQCSYLILVKAFLNAIKENTYKIESHETKVSCESFIQSLQEIFKHKDVYNEILTVGDFPQKNIIQTLAQLYSDVEKILTQKKLIAPKRDSYNAIPHEKPFQK